MKYSHVVPHLFEPLTLRAVTFPNRIFVSPMCEYSSVDGFANEWHLVHLGSRAVGGAGLVFTEATAVLPEGRITPRDLGIWSDAHIEVLAGIAAFIKSQGSVPGLQLAHAGRKASMRRPWEEPGAMKPEAGGWTPVAPSAEAFAPDFLLPRALAAAELPAIAAAFRDAARRARAAGFQVLELHAAHGYLLHEFLSPLSNHRTDDYGGSFENRVRLILDVVRATREVWPDELPFFVRISGTDWADGGWDIDQSVSLARELGPRGVDLVDCSSGGNVATAVPPTGPGFQTAIAARVRREAGIATGAVGLITSPVQADHILRTGQADAVLLARELLRDPYWPLRAARELGQPMSWPAQYLRAAPAGSPPRRP